MFVVSMNNKPNNKRKASQNTGIKFFVKYLLTIKVYN